MKLLLAAMLLCSPVLFAENLPGVTNETGVWGTPVVAQKFCSETHFNPTQACEEWLQTMKTSLAGATILKAYCKKFEDLNLGNCTRTGSMAGYLYFVK